MQPRVLAASLLAATALLAPACGEAAGTEDVRAAVAGYVAAARQGNGAQACAYYVRPLRRRVARRARRRGLSGCPELLGTALRHRLARMPLALRVSAGARVGDPEAIEVAMAGADRATATFAMPGATTASLVRTGAGWRIESLRRR